MPFFSNSSRKNRCSHTHILLQVRLFSKEHTVFKFMFYEKTSVLSKTMCSHVIFFQVFYEKSPCCHAHIWSKNVKSVKITLFWEKKTIGCPSFLIFHGKIIALISNVHILSKIVHSLKITCS